MKPKTIVITAIAAAVLIGVGIYVKKEIIDPKTVLKHSREAIAEVQSSTPIKDGDIIFQNTKAPYGEYITRTTGSQYNHLGIILSDNGTPYVYEAAETGRKTPLDEWIAGGKDGKFVIKRLKADSILTTNKLAKLRKEAEKVIGKEYDYTLEWVDDKAYSSEMVWKAYVRSMYVKLGELQTLKDFDISSPDIMKRFNERYTLIEIPYWEITVSPQTIFDSEELVTVAQR